MKALSRRRLFSGLAASALGAAILTAEPLARADLFGGDVAVLGSILQQTIVSVQTLEAMSSRILTTMNLLERMAQNLDHVSFQSIVAFLNAARFTVTTLTANMRAMGYGMDRIDSEFQTLFSGAPPPKTSAAAKLQMLQSWHQEVIGAAQVAARQQTSLALLETHAAKTQDLLSQSDKAGGQVASQLQVIAQLIGITNEELLILNQTLATTGRVLTTAAAASSSQSLSSLASGDDAWAGYTDDGAPVVVPTQLP